jgi:membrane associated rhomboid family serine protease
MDATDASADPRLRVVILLQRERFQEALRVLQATSPAALEPAEGLALRAEALLGLAEFQQAEDLAHQALRLDAGQARALYVLGSVALHDRRSVAEAVPWYRQATLADPTFAPAFHALGLLLLDAGFQDAAATALRHAQALEPANWHYAAGVARLSPPAQRAQLLRAAYRAGLRDTPHSPALRLRLLGTYVTGVLAPLLGSSPGQGGARHGMDVYRLILARPVVLTYLLLAINVAMYLVLETHGGSLNNQTLLQYGAEYPAAIVHQGQWWRLITPLFLHAGLTHLLVNGVSLYFVGVLYERCVGRSRFLYVYLVAGLGGSVASLAFSPDLAVGASGAIFGIFGGLGVYFFRNRALFGRISRSLVGQILVLSVLNLLLPNVVSSIDGWAHAGGLAAGAAAAWAAGPRLPSAGSSHDPAALLQERRPGRMILLQMVSVVLVLLVVTLLVVAWNPAGV